MSYINKFAVACGKMATSNADQCAHIVPSDAKYLRRTIYNGKNLRKTAEDVQYLDEQRNLRDLANFLRKGTREIGKLAHLSAAIAAKSAFYPCGVILTTT